MSRPGRRRRAAVSAQYCRRRGVPFVFTNFTGTHQDVTVLTHEIGHAFQMWQSRDKPIIEYLWPDGGGLRDPLHGAGVPGLPRTRSSVRRRRG
ncbi:MAG: M3 family metallopeptidase [Aliidongia sp.]